jgi:3-methylfumaryl-CoA hydratase
MEELKSCIGRTTERRDIITERMIAEFEATFSPHLCVSGAVPLGIQWCLSPDIVASEQIGSDGHPKLGAFLPDIVLPRRMWAGGEVTYHGHFNVGDVVKKHSEIVDVSFKEGKSGKLCFFQINHRYSVADRLIVVERQDVVYREAATAAGAMATQPVVSPKGETWSIAPTSTMLFRYSAMTFNGHRIHYDDPYARNVEGYDGLVVHGPLQATLMVNLAASLLGSVPTTFSYRGVSPLILSQPFVVDAVKTDGAIALQTISSSGVVTMTGHVAA